jgi:putative transposase
MDEIASLVGDSDCFELGFLKREATSESAMKIGIRLYLAWVSISDTSWILELVGVDWC